MDVFDQSEAVEFWVLLARMQTDKARQVLEEYETALKQTRDRIEQSRQRIIENDRLIAELAKLAILDGDHTSPSGCEESKT